MNASPERSDVERFRQVIVRRFGLQFDDSRLEHLADVLRRSADARGASGFAAYVEHLANAPGGAAELLALADELTVNETFFFRNADNFRALNQRVLPARIARRGADRRLSVLSAGCSSGEETYSLAVAVREALPDFERWTVKIIGIDLSPAMLAKAAEGRYSPWSLRATSEELRKRYFRPQGRDLLLDSEIKQMVNFELGNLAENDASLWAPGSYDLIFCRNVLMYFTQEVARKVVQRMARALVPGGFLFLGHAETLRGLSSDFELCHTHDTFYYQARSGTSDPVAYVDVKQPVGHWSELPEVVDNASSWVDAIQQASERIAALAKTAQRDTEGPPSHAAAVPAPACSWDLGQILEAMRYERFDDALALLLALPAESHAETDTLLLRAVLLVNAGKLQDAEGVCRQLLSGDDLSAGAHYVLALCREHAGDSAGAVEQDQIAMHLDPGFAMPHLHLGLMARRAKDQGTARQELGIAHALLEREELSRVLLFGGGFSRDTLLGLCHSELRAAENGGIS